jgi:hypothetical protein
MEPYIPIWLLVQGVTFLFITVYGALFVLVYRVLKTSIGEDINQSAFYGRITSARDNTPYSLTVLVFDVYITVSVFVLAFAFVFAVGWFVSGKQNSARKINTNSTN